ncbi:phospholipase D family protein [Rhodobacteraceae bacterium]|nr:phospholipase D family protein [Paracoccaceae bacterium]
MSRIEKDPIETLEVLVTADEAFPALERLFLSAETEIRAGFRIFDLATKLRSKEAKEIGETWFDLFQHTVNRGVTISLLLSDFDPIVGTKYHRKSWRSAQQMAGVDEISADGKLDFRVARHPAKAGIFPRLMLWKKVRDKLRETPTDCYTPGLRPVSPDSFFDISPVTHHQKLAVFDRKTLYIGGLDLDERRYDTPDHNQLSSESWRDVQVIVTGSVAAAAHRHLETLEGTVAGKSPPPPAALGFLRTVSAKRLFAPFHISPKTRVSEIEDAHMTAISRATELIFLENQYLRHEPLADALAEAAVKTPNLHLIAVLPAAPEDVAFDGNKGQDAQLGEHLQANAVKTLREAFGHRVLLCAPAQPYAAQHTDDRSSLAGAPIIYVHSKVSIFDDREAIVSSANLNGRSFRWDTEAGVHLTQKEHVARLAQRMSDTWMPQAPALLSTRPETVLAAWRAEVERNEALRPDQRRSFLLPYDETEAARLGQSIPIVPNELV